MLSKREAQAMPQKTDRDLMPRSGNQKLETLFKNKE